MRTIDATATAALLAGEGIFTARMVPSGLGSSVVVYNYEINGLSMIFRCGALSDWVGTQFTFTREVKIGTTTYSITAENYYMLSYETRNGFSTGIAHAIERVGYNGAADVSVYTLLQNIFGVDNVSMDNLYPRDVQFAPTGATITLANKADIIPILERKYFVKCMRNAGKLLFRNMALYTDDADNIFTTTEVTAFPTQAECVNFRTFEGTAIEILLTSMDESGVMTEWFTPPTTLPIQHIGFIPAATDGLDVYNSARDNIPLWSFEQRPLYTIEDGDNAWLTFRPTDEGVTNFKIIEKYNSTAEPPLRMIYSDMQLRPASSASSKGVDSPLSRAGADGISFETSQLLTGILDKNTTDVQHALEILSVHTHTGSGEDGFFFREWIGPVLDVACDPAYPGLAAGDRLLVSEDVGTLVDDFVGHNNDIAYWSGFAWIFHSPGEGSTLFLRSDDTYYRFGTTTWAPMRVTPTIHATTHYKGGSDPVLYDFPASDVNTETMTGNKTLTDASQHIQYLDPNGTVRLVTLPPEASTNHAFYIVNTGAYNITVKDDGGTTITTLYPSRGAVLVSNAVLWTPIYAYTNLIHEDHLTLIDQTNNNASTSKHGFLKKLSNTATEYMDGTGTWSTPAGGGSSDGWNTQANTWSHSEGVRGSTASRAYTNDPAAGSNITLNIADTSIFNVGDYVVVSSSAGKELAKITTVNTNTSIVVDTLALNHTTTTPKVFRQERPSFIASVNADVTGVLTAGMKLKLTQDSTIKYFIVSKVGTYSGGATLITLYGGTDYSLTTNAISNVYYSTDKFPYAFPYDPAKWEIIISDSTQVTQSSPTASQPYNLGDLFIIIPPGTWNLGFFSYFQAYDSSGSSVTGWAKLSTSYSTFTADELTCIVTIQPVGATAINLYNSSQRATDIRIETMTAYYFLGMTKTASITQIASHGEDVPTRFRASALR